MWVVEVLNEKHPGHGVNWTAWESYAFETRRAARKAMTDHKRTCWTETRIRKYTRSEE